jgi:hypothetical protein
MGLENFNLRSINEARLDKLNHPLYLAGSLDGFITTNVRRRDYGYELSLVGESRVINIAQVWHHITNCAGNLSDDQTRWSLYDVDLILKFLTNFPPYHLITRKEELVRFLNIIQSLIAINSGRCDPRTLQQFEYYLDFYKSLRENGYKILEINEIAANYLAGLFELSSKGTIRFESPSSFSSTGRTIIQVATPHQAFAEAMQRFYGGGSFTIKPNASYLWKVTGKKADQFLEQVLLPNSVWGDRVLMHKIKSQVQVEM